MAMIAASMQTILVDFWLCDGVARRPAQPCASLRRYIIGVQTRALHIRMRTAWTKEEHLAYAMELEHPHTLAGKALEPEWQFVFAQLAFAFETFGVPDTIVRLDAYRARILDWIRKLARTVTPLQRQLNLEMPEGIRAVAWACKFGSFLSPPNCSRIPESCASMAIFPWRAYCR